jgi:hypothetical protein
MELIPAFCTELEVVTALLPSATLANPTPDTATETQITAERSTARNVSPNSIIIVYIYW